MKLACVIHRYGAEVTGGSEAHCRAVAQRLAARHDVTVLTSCAKDYVTWRDEYPPGASMDGAVRVIRFRVARTRNLHEFRALSELVFSGRATEAEQRRWFEENGPLVPDLIRHLAAHGREYDRILFWSYRYYPSFCGLPQAADRAILVPTAEEDPLIRASILPSFFARPRAYLFLTPEEADLVRVRLPGACPPSETIGIGLDPPPPVEPPVAASGIERPYVLYLGRIERNKGCESLFRHFLHYVERGGPPIGLAVAGPALMAVPAHPLITPLGVVSDRVRDGLVSGARALVVPSPYESLSIVLLEAWNHGVPALVNARCRVLKGQVLRADGGLYYADAEEFSECLRLIVDQPALAAQLGAQGRAYVDREYRWPGVMEKIERVLAV